MGETKLSWGRSRRGSFTQGCCVAGGGVSRAGWQPIGGTIFSVVVSYTESSGFCVRYNDRSAKSMLLFAILGFGIFTMWIPGRWAPAIFEVAILVLAGARVMAWMRGAGAAPSFGRLRWIVPGLMIPSLMIGATAWIGVQLVAGWTVDVQRTQEQLLQWVVYSCVVGLATGVGAGERESGQVDGFGLGRITEAVVWGATGLAVLAILTAISSPVGVVWWWVDVGSDQITLGPFVYRNQYAAFVEVCLAIALLKSCLGKYAWRYVAASGILFASVVASGSRGGTILCLVELVVFPVILVRRGQLPIWTWVRGAAVSVGSVALATWIVGWDYLVSRLNQSNPYALRADLLRSSLQMIRERPWRGFGLGTWAEVYPGFALYDAGRYVNQAHNDWVQWTAEGGIVFGCIVLAIFLWVTPRAFASVWGVGLLVMAVHAFFDYPMHQRPALAAFFFAMLGYLNGVDARSASGRVPLDA